MKTAHVLAAALLAAALAGCATTPAPTQLFGESVAVAAPQGWGAGTLAPVGSFEWQAAPVATQLALREHEERDAIRSGAATDRQAAVDFIMRAMAVRKELGQAVGDCAEDDRTGQCTGSRAQAESELDDAAQGLASLQVTQ